MRNATEWHKHNILSSIIFLLVAFIIGVFILLEGGDEWKFTTLGLGLIAPIGHIIRATIIHSERKWLVISKSDSGCFLVVFFLFVGLAMSILGAFTGIPLIFLALRGNIPAVSLLGFALGVSGGFAIVKMGKSSYALFALR